MRRPVKVKALARRSMARKSALTASAAARRGFPAWIDASERSVPPPVVTVTPRVRDALILRKVGKRKATKGKGPTHVAGVR